MKRRFHVGMLTCWLLFAAAANANTILMLDPPGGAISGAAGTTVGWGFTFTNDTNYAVITGTEFCSSSSNPLPDICLPPAPNLGTYTDFAGAQFLVAGPAPESTSVTQAFDNTLQTGLASFAITPGASGTVSGFIVLTYDLFSVSPNDPSFSLNDEIAGGNYLTAAASVTVESTTTVPEPSLLVLLTGLLLLLLPLKKRFLSRSVSL